MDIPAKVQRRNLKTIPFRKTTNIDLLRRVGKIAIFLLDFGARCQVSFEEDTVYTVYIYIHISYRFISEQKKANAY